MLRKKIFNELNKLDDCTLDILVDYNSKDEPESGSLFDYRSELTPEDEIPTATNI